MQSPSETKSLVILGENCSEQKFSEKGSKLKPNVGNTLNCSTRTEGFGVVEAVQKKRKETDNMPGPSKLRKHGKKTTESSFRRKLRGHSKGDNLKIRRKTKEQAIDFLLKVLPSLGEDSEIIGKIGEGSYSTVYLARVKSNASDTFNTSYKEFAIKLFKDVDFGSIDREIEILQLVGGSDNIISYHSNARDKNFCFLAMPFHAHDSFKHYVSNMDVEETRQYMYSLMVALNRIHSYGVVHRDIKPSNFLYKRDIKSFMLVDFGLSTYVQSIEENPRKVGTRGFQAPEVLLGYQLQTTAIDMWSAGIIFISILSKTYPFFRPQESDDLLELIKTFGSKKIIQLAKECDQNVPRCENTQPLDISKLCERLRRYRDIKSQRELITFHNLPNCSQCKHPVDDKCDGCVCLNSASSSNIINVFPPSAYDLLKKLLDVNHLTRISADDALNHPFLKSNRMV